MATSDQLLPTPQAIDSQGEGRPLRFKKDIKRNPNSPGSWRGDLKDHISLLVDSPVSLFPKLDEDEEHQTLVGSGQKCFELFNLQNPNSSLRRMCEVLLTGKGVWHSDKCYLTWKAKAISPKRLLFQLLPSTPRTGGIGSGLLHTPSQQEPGVMVERLQTKGGEPAKVGERAYDKHTGRLAQVGLQQQIRMLKTPSASEAEGGWKVTDKYWNAKAPKLKMRDQVGRKTGLKLQPAFALWMMGYPTDYLDLKDGEMPPLKQSGIASSRKLQKKL